MMGRVGRHAAHFGEARRAKRGCGPGPGKCVRHGGFPRLHRITFQNAGAAPSRERRRPFEQRYRYALTPVGPGHEEAHDRPYRLGVDRSEQAGSLEPGVRLAGAEGAPANRPAIHIGEHPRRRSTGDQPPQRIAIASTLSPSELGGRSAPVHAPAAATGAARAEQSQQIAPAFRREGRDPDLREHVPESSTRPAAGATGLLRAREATKLAGREATDRGRSHAVFPAECVGQVAVRREAGGVGDGRDAVTRVEQALERLPQPKPQHQPVNRHTGVGAHQAVQMERGASDLAGNVVERQGLPVAAGDHLSHQRHAVRVLLLPPDRFIPTTRGPRMSCGGNGRTQEASRALLDLERSHVPARRCLQGESVQQKRSAVERRGERREADTARAPRPRSPRQPSARLPPPGQAERPSTRHLPGGDAVPDTTRERG